MKKNTKKKKTIIPNAQEIEEKREEFRKNLELKKLEEKNGNPHSKKNFLLALKNDIQKFVENGISFVSIKKSIFEVYQIEISTQMISQFVKKEITLKKEEKDILSDMLGEDYKKEEEILK